MSRDTADVKKLFNNLFCYTKIEGSYSFSYRYSYSSEALRRLFAGRLPNCLELFGSCLLKSETECKSKNLTPVDITLLEIQLALECVSNRFQAAGILFKCANKRREMPIPYADSLLFVAGVDSL